MKFIWMNLMFIYMCGFAMPVWATENGENIYVTISAHLSNPTDISVDDGQLVVSSIDEPEPGQAFFEVLRCPQEPEDLGDFDRFDWQQQNCEEIK